MQVERDVSAPDRLIAMVTGTWVSQALSVAAALGVADVLAEGPLPVDDIAERVGADPSALCRLLRALADVDVVRETDGRRFATTETGELLRSDRPDSLRALAMLVGLPPWRRMWTDLLTTVRTGEPAFERVLGGSPFEYLRQHPEYAAIFDDAMTALSRRLTAAVTEAYDFGAFGTIVDVGGGNGALLASVLRANPGTRGVLYDLPDVVEGAEKLLADAEVADRCERVGGDFFDSVPAGADAYVLANVIHDWDDDRSARILANCRTAAAPSTRLLLAEMVVVEGEPSFANWADMEMLLIGGRQRTAEEFSALLSRAGWRLSRIVPGGLFSLVEGEPR